MFIPNLVIFVILQKNVMNTMIHSGIKWWRRSNLLLCWP
jgi:hypothetical protein